MTVEVFRCKECGTIMVVDRKKLWATKSCSSCESTNIEIFTAVEDDEDTE